MASAHAPKMHSQIEREEKDKGPLNKWITSYGFLTDEIHLTKRGDLCSVLKLKGLDAECLEPEAIARHCQRFEQVLRTLGPEYYVYQYLIKRDSPEFPPASNDTLEQYRHDFLESRKEDLFQVESYLAILRKPTRATQPLLSRLSLDRSLTISMKAMESELRALSIATESIAIQLRDHVQPEILGMRDTTRFLRSLINPTPWKAEVHGNIPECHLDQYLGQTHLLLRDDHLKMDDFYIKLLSMIDQPQVHTPLMLRRVLEIPTNVIICSQWNRIPNGKMRKNIDAARRHYHSAVFSAMNVLYGKPTSQYEVMPNKSKLSVIDILDEAQKQIETKENFFGHWHYTMALMCRSHADLRHAVAEVTEIFSTHDARIIEERDNAQIKAWASIIPGNYAYALRHQSALNLTHAELSPAIFTPSEGERVSKYLGKPALAIVETNEGVPYYLDLHYGQVGHMVMLGATDSGKSVLMNFLVASAQKRKPYTVIFDIGGSYRALTAHYGGSYMDIGSHNDTFTINPFSLPMTKENLDFQFGLVRVLIERNNSTLTDDQQSDLHEAIKSMYVVPESERRLSTLQRMVQRSYAGRFNAWTGEGRYAEYFDNASDTLSMAQFQCFDFQGMSKGTQNEALEPLLFYILHRANSIIYDPTRRMQQKIVVCDEAWRFFRNPITRDYIKEGLKTGRKHNWSMLLATQSAADLQESELLPTIVESCMTRFFLPNPGQDDKIYCETFGLTATQAEKIKGLRRQQQFLLQRATESKVLNLFLDKESLKVFANKGDV